MVMRVEKHQGDKQETTKVKAHHCQRRFEWMRWRSLVCRTDLGGYHVMTFSSTRFALSASVLGP